MLLPSACPHKRRPFEKSGRALRVSVSRGRPEVSAHCQNGAIDPLQTFTLNSHGDIDALVLRFRSSQIIAATSDANFGIKGALASYCF